MARMFAPERANNLNVTVSEDSAAMPLRYGGICNDHFVANFVLSLAVNFENRSIFREVIDTGSLGRVSCFLYSHCRNVLLYCTVVCSTIQRKLN